MEIGGSGSGCSSARAAPVSRASSSMEPWCELHLLLAGATSGLSGEVQEGCGGAQDGRACDGVQVRTAAAS
ncbi:hypothetical protein E2562_004770 [Oryza meyeriana var. granulata]|uniref:Uncharacterized protein n=1 Tax=Oryza meyeriana var. granulata TaxID=110450 RepID=A0A6G1DGC9_9ORYZ|nr:hypothetical protein E2562_004770 [Oryza meyeriana var. granulata]